MNKVLMDFMQHLPAKCSHHSSSLPSFPLPAFSLPTHLLFLHSNFFSFTTMLASSFFSCFSSSLGTDFGTQLLAHPNSSVVSKEREKERGKKYCLNKLPKAI